MHTYQILLLVLGLVGAIAASMTVTTISSYADEITAGRPPLYAPTRPAIGGGRVRTQTFRLTLASQVSGTSIAVARIPPGARILGGSLVASGTLANSATLAVGLAAVDASGQIDDSTGTVNNVANASATGPVLDQVACLKAAAAQGATLVQFGITLALGYNYDLAKECWLTLTTGTGTVSTEVVLGQVNYVVD